jgi:hypothetical protein
MRTYSHGTGTGLVSREACSGVDFAYRVIAMGVEVNSAGTELLNGMI